MSNLLQRISQLEKTNVNAQRPLLTCISEKLDFTEPALKTLPETIKEYNKEYETNYKEADFSITMIEFI